MDAFADRPRGGGEEGGEVVASCFPEGQIYNSVSSSRTRGGGEKSLGEGKVGGGGDFGISFSQTRVRFSVTRLRDSDVRLAPLSADTYPVSTHFSPRILTKFPSFDPTTIACETNAVTRHVSFSRAKQRVYPRTKLQRAFSSELRVDFSTSSSHEKRSVSKTPLQNCKPIGETRVTRTFSPKGSVLFVPVIFSHLTAYRRAAW